MSNNNITIVGRLGGGPESKGSGTKLSLAVDRPGKKDGEKITDWFTVWLFDKSAEIAQEYLKKGGLVAVSGRMQSFKTPEGATVWAIQSRDFTMLGSKEDK